MAVDELLKTLDNNGFEIQGYADDRRGKFEYTIFDILQKALNIVAKWCVKVNLKCLITSEAP